MNYSQFFNRLKQMILNPQMEWVRIESENTSGKELLKGYILPFIILISVFSFIGATIFTLQLIPISVIIIKTLITAVLLGGGVLLSAVIINELCSSFATVRNPEATLKLITYSFTSFFIACCLVGLLPDLPILLILGLHSVYLFWTGTTTLLKTPEHNKAGFVIVSLLIITGIYAILTLIIKTIVIGMMYVVQP